MPHLHVTWDLAGLSIRLLSPIDVSTGDGGGGGSGGGSSGGGGDTGYGGGVSGDDGRSLAMFELGRVGGIFEDFLDWSGYLELDLHSFTAHVSQSSPPC
jgi:hypothetical protein